MVVSSIPAAALSVGWYCRMCDRLRADIPHRCVTSHPGQLCLLPSVGREISTGQSAVMRCGRGSKAERLFAFVDKRVGGWQVKLCDSSLTRAILSALEARILMTMRYTKCPVLILILKPSWSVRYLREHSVENVGYTLSTFCTHPVGLCMEETVT